MPSSSAALGDSLTRAFGSAGTLADDPSSSWSTGDAAAVDSHYLRLLRRNPAIAGNTGNYAVSGSKMAATWAQAGSAVTQGATYVTIFSGTNDVCTGTVAEMTSAADFATQLRSTLARLTSGTPGVTILVLSIPNWHAHWLAYRSDPAAVTAWAFYYGGVCPTIFGAATSDADREAARQRIVDLNAAAAAVCAEFAACTYDGGATSGLAFAPSDLAFDFFHLTQSGQAHLASAAWQAGPFAQPPALESFAATPGVDRVDLGWVVPSNVTRVVIVQKAGSAPASPADGTVVYDGTGAGGAFTVNGLTGGVTYDYAAWTYDVDGVQGSVARTSATPNVAPPVNTALPVVSGSATEGQTLSASTGSWSGSPTGYEYQWRRCDASGGGCASVGGATSSSYVLAPADVGSTVRVVVTATNAGGTASATSAATGVVASAAPVVTNLASNPGFESDPFVSYYTWGTGTFSWASDAAHGGLRSLKIVGTTPGSLARWLSRTTSITASAGKSYTAAAWFETSGASQGAYLAINFWNAAQTHLGTYASPNVVGTTDWTRVSVTATAPAGTVYVRVEFRLTGPGTLWSDDVLLTNGSTTVAPPVNTALPVVSGAATEGQTLSASTGSWSGSPTGYEFQWRRCDAAGAGCVSVGGATAATYVLGAADVGSTLRVVVTATNAGGAASATSAATAVAIAASVVNLASNPGFESDPSAAYYTWGAGTFSWASDAAHGGLRSLKIVGTTSLARWLSLTTSLTASPGRSYTASAWLKTSGVTQYAYLVINFWSASPVHLGTFASPSISGSAGWTNLSVSAIAPAGTAYVRIEFRLTGPGTLWADDVLLTS